MVLASASCRSSRGKDPGFYQPVRGESNGTLKAKSAGNDRPPQMDVEAKPAFASGDVEIEATVAEVQVPRRAEGVVDRAHDLPIGMRTDAKAAEIAIGGQREAVAEVAVIARADQRVRPAAAGRHAHSGKQTGIERDTGGESPGAEPEASIGELYRVFEHAPERDPGALIGAQLGSTALVKYIVRGDVR